MKKLDKIFKGIIEKSITTQYMISYNNQIVDLETQHMIYPSELSEFIETSFDIHKDIADLITFGWLLENDFEDIRLNWEPVSFNGYNSVGTILGGPESQLTIDYGGYYTLTGTSETITIDDDTNITTTEISDTIVIGSNNTVTTSDTIVIGDGNTVSYSGAGQVLTSNSTSDISWNGGYSNYIAGIDVGNDDSTTTIVQMHPNGTYEIINH